MKMPGRKFFIPLILLAAWFGGRYWYFTVNAEKGEMAPSFTATTLTGEQFTLSDLRGKSVLLDFWGSWCGPCRRESPSLRELAKRYPDELTIVSIAIEKDSVAWQRALQKDRRFWPHQVMDQTSSLKFLSGEIADLYGVNSVPTNILIWPDGSVAGVDLDFPELEEYVKESK